MAKDNGKNGGRPVNYDRIDAGKVQTQEQILKAGPQGKPADVSHGDFEKQKVARSKSQIELEQRRNQVTKENIDISAQFKEQEKQKEKVKEKDKTKDR